MAIVDEFTYVKNKVSDIYMHMDMLAEYASSCDHITEMGVRNVVSTWAFLMGSPKELVSIDINECPVEHAATLAKSAGIKFSFLQEDTTKIQIAVTDLLFIDTLHNYEQLITELRLHSKNVRKYIILHDTATFGWMGETPGHKGLMPAVIEFLENNSEWVLEKSVKYNNGLTILKRL